ncbi:receptor-like protein EIX2 [Actinidia eriantha]|uniref:receptor-like protein EIX2 n=1 Tax=Actinidia eriantha TaxID=165200 RepID=UPI002585ECF2|nr:receptor-like protein EIX2 [Actinidia eriantha]
MVGSYDDGPTVEEFAKWFALIGSIDDLESAKRAGELFGYPRMIKNKSLAYDGRGNAVARREEEISSAVNGGKPIPLLHVFVVLLLVCNKLAHGLTSDAKILKFKETLIDDYGLVFSLHGGAKNLKKTVASGEEFGAITTPHLTYLGLSGNSFEGNYYPIPHHLGNFSNLSWLFNLSSSLVHVDLQDNLLNGSVPDAFGNVISLEHLNLAFNQFEGGIPKSFANLCHWQSLMSCLLPDLSLTISCHATLDLRSNRFTGQILRVPSNVKSLSLSKNLFSGSISSLCENTGFELSHLDFSSNGLSGDCWEHFEEPRVMSLSNNNLSGKLPSSMGSLFQIKELQLLNNNFSGELPVFEEMHRFENY